MSSGGRRKRNSWRVLVVPYWNVNTYGAMCYGTMGFVLVVPYWNVNKDN